MWLYFNFASSCMCLTINNLDYLLVFEVCHQCNSMPTICVIIWCYEYSLSIYAWKWFFYGRYDFCISNFINSCLGNLMDSMRYIMIYRAFVLVIGKVQTKKDCYRLFERVYLLKLRSCISFALRFKWNRI